MCLEISVSFCSFSSFHVAETTYVETFKHLLNAIHIALSTVPSKFHICSNTHPLFPALLGDAFFCSSTASSAGTNPTVQEQKIEQKSEHQNSNF